MPLRVGNTRAPVARRGLWWTRIADTAEWTEATDEWTAETYSMAQRSVLVLVERAAAGR